MKYPFKDLKTIKRKRFFEIIIFNIAPHIAVTYFIGNILDAKIFELYLGKK